MNDTERDARSSPEEGGHEANNRASHVRRGRHGPPSRFCGHKRRTALFLAILTCSLVLVRGPR
jgi:hypothetical protein